MYESSLGLDNLRPLEERPEKIVDGRPRIDVDYDMVENLAAQGLTQSQICQAMGFSMHVWRDRIKYDPDFRSAVEIGKHKGLATVTNAVFRAAINGSVQAQMFWLRTRFPNEWNPELMAEIAQEARRTEGESDYIHFEMSVVEGLPRPKPNDIEGDFETLDQGD